MLQQNCKKQDILFNHLCKCTLSIANFINSVDSHPYCVFLGTFHIPDRNCTFEAGAPHSLSFFFGLISLKLVSMKFSIHTGLNMLFLPLCLTHLTCCFQFASVLDKLHSFALNNAVAMFPLFIYLRRDTCVHLSTVTLL